MDSRAGGPGPNRGWRTTIAVAATMIGLVVGVNLVNASIPLPEQVAEIDPGFPDEPLPADPDQPSETLTPIDPGPVAPGEAMHVGAGWTISPPAGWTVIGQQDDVTLLQQGDVILIVGGIPSEDTPEDLAAWYRDAWFADGGFTGGEPVAREIGDVVRAAELDYTGALEGSQVDGRIVAGSAAGSGVLINAFAPTGSLAPAFGEIEAILASVRLEGS